MQLSLSDDVQFLVGSVPVVGKDTDEDVYVDYLALLNGNAVIFTDGTTNGSHTRHTQLQSPFKHMHSATLHCTHGQNQKCTSLGQR